MTPNKRLAILFSVVIFIVFFALGFDKIDPFYKTETTINAKIIKRIYATGKSGARIEITLKTNSGKIYWFNKAINYSGKKGDEVKLRLYKRKLTGLKKYKLD